MKDNSQSIQAFEEQISFIFDGIRKLPYYGQAYPAYIVQLRSGDSYGKIREVLASMKIGAVDVLKTNDNSLTLNLSTGSKVALIWANDEESFRWLYDFHSYSNGVIIGKMLKKIGLKYSDEGLQYIQYDLRQNHQSEVGSITITRNFSRILEILELDKNEFKKGFTNTDEIFSFFVKSPYLKVDKFINPEKEQKNIILQKFEEYLILNNIRNDNYKSLEFERIKELFPEIDFNSEIAKLVAKAERKQELVDKFNGRIIMEMIPDF